MNERTLTEEEIERRSLGQRRINLIWETTQAAIALIIVGANIAAAFYPTTPADSLLANGFFLVIGFYFGRTNHARPPVPWGSK